MEGAQSLALASSSSSSYSNATATTGESSWILDELGGEIAGSSSSSSFALLLLGNCPFVTAAGHDVEYLYLVPILFVLGLNTFFLVWIMWVSDFAALARVASRYKR